MSETDRGTDRAGAIEPIVSDNGACYRAGIFEGSRHQRITPHTPWHNGKIERYNRILAGCTAIDRG